MPSHAFEAPAMGERRARLGYGAQDRLAAGLILQALKLRTLQAVRLADLQGGQVDDFVCVWEGEVEGNSVKWTGTSEELSWADLCGATEPLIPQLAEGWKTLRAKWPGYKVRVYLRTNRPASAGTHGNQLVPGLSLETFLTLSWPAFRRGEPSENSQIEAAWALIKSKSGLSPAEFREFALDCFVLPGLSVPSHSEPNSLDAAAWEHEFDRLRQAINDWVERNPDEEEISATHLRRIIDASSSRTLLQQFPDPEIGYEENVEAAHVLRAALQQHKSGYLALIGPAGAGKSTLVGKIIEDEPFGIPYFAYLPAGAGDPRQRGDALAFYRHLLGVLDSWDSVREAHSITDLAHAREAFARHMERVSQRFQKTGRKTLILVDGLDHVVREEGLERPVQRELPLPDELPEGCLILIGTQPQAINALREPIRTQLEDKGRVIEVEPLPPELARRCFAPDRIGRVLSPEQQESGAQACGGSPLFLTYLVRLLRSAPEVEAATLIEKFGIYSGDSDAYYSERFRPLLDNPEWKRMLALLCRTRGRVPLEWLQSWPDWYQFEHLHRLHLAAFFRLEDGRLSVLHNSLTSYLRRATRPTSPQSAIEQAERRLHLQLADLYPAGSCADEPARERLYHLVLAGEHRAVLSVATIEWFREGAVAFVPLDDLNDLAWTCMRSAVELEDHGAMLRFIAVTKEIDQRTVVVESDELARRFCNLGQPQRAVEHVFDGSKLRVDPKPALRFCDGLASIAKAQGDEFLARKARHIFELAKPVRLLYAAGPVSIHGTEGLDLVEAWVKVAPRFVSLSHIAETIGNLAFENRRDNPDERPPLVRAFLLNQSLETALECDLEGTDILTDAIGATGESGWLFQSRLQCLENAQRREHDAESFIENLREVRDFESLREDARLRVVGCLWHAGKAEEARSLLETLQLPTPSPYPENQGRSASRLGGVEERVKVAKLRVILGLPPLSIVPDAERDYEGADRVAVACQEIGALWGELLLGRKFDDLEERFERFLTFHLRRVVDSNPGRFTHWAEVTRREIYNVLLRLAEAASENGGKALWSAVVALDGRRGTPFFFAPHLRDFALGLRRLGAITVTEALTLLGRSTEDSRSEDTHERSQACFEIAQAFHGLGDEASVRIWLNTAGRASHGIGGHKDYQMLSWMEWLDRSLPQDPEAVFAPEVALAARTLEVAGGDGGVDARVQLVAMCFARHPLIGVKLGIEMIERGLLQFSHLLEAVIPAAAKTGAEPRLLAAIYARLYLLVAPRPVNEVGHSIVQHIGDASLAQEVARLCIAAIKTNVPSDRRRSTVRGIVDALHERGLDAPDLQSLEKVLAPDADEGSSSSSWLYRMPDGTSRSVAGVSRLLSDIGQRDKWNPHPNDNKGFAWARALENVSLQSDDHLNTLEQEIATGEEDRQSTEVLASLSRAAARSGYVQRAQRFAEAAYDKARDGGWVVWLDGAYKRKALESLVALDPEQWVPVAQREFVNDLLQKRIGSQSLIQSTGDIFDLLRWIWPQSESREIMKTYFGGLTQEIAEAPDYDSLLLHEDVWTPDEALCYLLSELFAHPVVEVAAASRIALADAVCSGSRSPLRAFERLGANRTIEIERALAVLHVAALDNPRLVTPFRAFVDSAQQSQSAAVTSVARRICAAAGWPVPPLATSVLAPIYSLAFPSEPRDFVSLLRAGAREIPTASLGVSLELYRGLLDVVAQQAGLSPNNVFARARQIYDEQEQEHSWTREGDARLDRWSDRLPVLHFVRPRAMVARDAAMRVVGELIRSGRLDESFYAAYDSLTPIYDPHLESASPAERPSEIEGITVGWMNAKWPEWVAGLNKKELQQRAYQVAGRIVLAEQSTFRMADWKWPEEERTVALLPGSPSQLRVFQPKELIPVERARTRAFYEDYEEDVSPVISNEADQLTTPASNWVALNPVLGDALGWELSEDGLFRWVDKEGQTMVESVWWRDGWTRLKPPLSFKTLGEGWLVLCASEAFNAIRQSVGPCRFVARGRRSCQVDKGEQPVESILTIEMGSEQP